MADWIDEFMDATSTLRSPESFRLWTGISTIASLLERRCYTILDAPTPLRPNLYTILAGGPASGKTIMTSVSREILVSLAGETGIHLAPDNPTKASFLDSLQAATKAVTHMDSPDLLVSSLVVLCREFGTLISKYDKEFAADLTDIYDTLPNYTAPRRTSKSVNIEAPCINILAAATPAALGDTIPENAWDQGLTSRIIFVYGTQPSGYRDMFQRTKRAQMDSLKARAKAYYNDLSGEFIWEEDAMNAVRHWFNEENQEPRPTYGKLVNYCGRRNEHLVKLAMVSAVAADHGMTVTESDFRRAQHWLFLVEETMPDIFRAMVQRSDAQLLEDCHYWAWSAYHKMIPLKRKPFSDKQLWNFFADKAPHDKIKGLIEAMEKVGRMRKTLTGFVPNNLSDFSDEVHHEPPTTNGFGFGSTESIDYESP